MNRAAWLEERRSGLGASDMPDLIGVGYGDALRVYRSKVEPADATEPTTGPLARGIALEETVAGLYSRVMGVELAPDALTRHPARPWQMATPDRVRPDGRRVQIKTTAGFGDQWGEQGTGDVPAGYRVQVQQEMGVTGTDWIDVAALDVIAWELRVYRVEFDAELFGWLTDVGARFLRDHVHTLTPPGPEWDAQFDPRRFVTGKAVELGSDVAGLLDMRKEIKGVLDDAQAEYDRLTARVLAVLGDAERGACPGWTLKRTTIPGGPVSYDRRPSTRLDVRAVKPKRGEQ